MSLFPLISARWHALIADYGAAAVLALAALFARDASSGARATGFVIAAALLVGSLITAYPLGVVRVLPFRVHSAADYLGAVALIATPFVLDFYASDRGLAQIYIAVGVADVVLSLCTDYRDPAAEASRRGSGAGSARA